MRIGIIGSREEVSEDDLKELIEKIENDADMECQVPVFLTTTSSGVDSQVIKEIKNRPWDLITLVPNFLLPQGTKYNPKEFYLRTVQLVNNCDRLYVIHVGGTALPGDVAHGIGVAHSNGIDVTIHEV